ncbi:MAG: nitrate reductase cytochrome c-type subunit [Myxococcales bacterium]|nr:nitrate reductase cytochrome c-type subunit [Myxococcales bacterium]
MNAERDTRALQVLAALCVTASVLGFVSGTHDTAPLRPYRAPRERLAGEIESAPTYALEREVRRGNRARHSRNFAAMQSDRPQLWDPVPAVDDATRAAALQRRAEHRAYNGAPPTIPHAIDQQTYPNCLSCHEHGMRIGERVAPMMSHQRYDNCFQCHVTSEQPMPGARLDDQQPPYRDNAFVGLESQPSARWGAGAPPPTPHSTLMRSRCESCHGVFGSGIRSTHPHRQSCVQCHAVSATLDQRPFAPIEGAP